MALPSVISSQDSERGPTQLALLDGPTTENSGRVRVHANRSLSPVNAKERQTNGTYGRTSETSSPSANLQRSLESRLRQRMDVDGSLEYELTWKHWDMQSGPPICALRARARRTSGNVFSGWPSPMAGSPETETYHEAGNTDSSRRTVSLLTGWPTPNAQDGPKGGPNQGTDRLPGAAALTGWPSPQARDHFPAYTPEYIAEKKAQGHGMANLNDTVMLCADGADTPDSDTTGNTDAQRTAAIANGLTGCPTASARDWKNGKSNQHGKNARPRSPDHNTRGGSYADPEKALKRQSQGHQINLEDQAVLAGWSTPNVPTGGRSIAHAEMIGGTCYHEGKKVQIGLEAQAKMVSGPTTTSCPAATAKRGGLSPEHSRWLMGLPSAWTQLAPLRVKAARNSSGPTATRLYRKSRPSS